MYEAATNRKHTKWKREDQNYINIYRYIKKIYKHIHMYKIQVNYENKDERRLQDIIYTQVKKSPITITR